VEGRGGSGLSEELGEHKKARGMGHDRNESGREWKKRKKNLHDEEGKTK